MDEVEYEEEGLAESLLDENAIASLPSESSRHGRECTVHPTRVYCLLHHFLVQDQGLPCGWQQERVAPVRGSAPSASPAVPSVASCALALSLGGPAQWSRL